MTAPAEVAPAPSPRVLVPNVGLSPPSFGLLSAARVLDDVPAHQLNGVEYPVVCSPGVAAYQPPCGPVDTGLPTEKAATVTPGFVAADPLVLYAADECPPVGRDQDETVTRLRQAFLAAEHTGIERAVESGAAGNAPSLADSALPLNGGAALDVPDAVALLEAWIAANVGTGVLHAPRWAAGRVDPADRKTSGARSVTAFGNTWAWGSGYTGPAPAAATAADAGVVWLYATAPVTVRRGPLIEPADWTTGGFGVADNSGLLLVERMSLVEWPCRAAAVATTLPRLDPTTGEGGA